MRNLLIVGGTGRNVGKTALLCRVISRVARYAPVYALKVSAVYPDEAMYHGNHGEAQSEGPLPVEETRTVGNKDTIRLLRAGATRVFYLQSAEEDMRAGFEAFLSQVPAEAAIVCESNSLDTIVAAGLHIMVRGMQQPIKSRALPALARADRVVFSDGESGFSACDAITFTAYSGWVWL